MHRVEVMADRYSGQEDQTGDDPGIFGTERQRVMVRQHQEDNWQRQIVVMRRPHLRDLAVLRVRRTPCL